MGRTLSIGLFSALLICMSMENVVSYSKYGRTCRDIGCMSGEICEIVSDCNTYPPREVCGKYPTCKKTEQSGGLTCAAKSCPPGEYCRTISGTPTCVNNSPGSGFESAGVSSVNGHRVDDGTNRNPDVTHTNINPYTNANAPPPEHHDTGSNIRPNTNFGLGYPPDPPHNTGNNQPYPGSGVNHPGNYPYNGGYPLYPPNQQPPSTHNQYPNYPVNNRNQNTRRFYNSATECMPRLTLLGFSIFGLVLITKYLS